jgi:hypothetical protein
LPARIVNPSIHLDDRFLKSSARYKDGSARARKGSYEETPREYYVPAQAIQPVGKALDIAYDIHSSGFL